MKRTFYNILTTIRQLSFFWFGIAWHWKWSLTWRWIASIRRHNPGVRMGFHKMRTHQGQAWLIVWNTKLLDFVFQSQPNMSRRRIELDAKYKKLLDGIAEKA